MGSAFHFANFHTKYKRIIRFAGILAILLPLLAGCQPGPAAAGAPGAGDTYFPGLGNGGYDVSHYLLVLDIDPPSNQVHGTVTIDAITTMALSDFNLDFQGMTVDSIQVNSKPAAFSRQRQRIEHPSCPGAGGQPEIYRQGRISRQPAGS